MINTITKPEIMNQLMDQRDRVLASFGLQQPELVLKNGSFINVFTNELEKGDIVIHKGYIVGIVDNYAESNKNNGTVYNEQTKIVDCTDRIICPGFIDGHIHIESSMLSPKEFANAVVPHGTTTVITDPHEIANVAGEAGIDFMLNHSEGLPLDIYMMAPSCVPATAMDESGAILEADSLVKYMEEPRILGLAELMNAFGTVRGDEKIFRKIALTKEHNKIIDGHGPGLHGRELDAYITAGVTSDHECSTIEEAVLKLKRGQWIMIREGTAAKNMDALMLLFQEPYCSRCMLVTDDKHPGDLMKLGHMDHLVKKAVQNGADPILAIKMATLHPALYFGLIDSGAVAPGYKADLVIMKDMDTLLIDKVLKNGEIVAFDGHMKQNEEIIQDKSMNEEATQKVYVSFHMKELVPNDFQLKEEGNQMRVIELTSGELLTKLRIVDFREPGVDIANDIIKLAVAERHHNTGHIGIGFLKGYGLREGAIASSIAHDSHNLMIAGTNEEDMCLAGNCVRKNQGGLAIALNGKIVGELALPIAGLMCEKSAEEVDNILTAMKQTARNMGIAEGIDPFMTLAFLSLPVIPEIRITTFGLADVSNQCLFHTIF